MSFLRLQAAELWADLREVGTFFLAVALEVWKLRSDLLQWGAIAGGWAGVTEGIAPVISRLGLEVWPLSGGLFLLSLAGWKYLRNLFTTGVYTFVRSKK